MILCLFEQSGTFKRALQTKYPTENVYDIDMSDKFGETDIKDDLFANWYNHVSTCTKNDLILCFFPCTWFSNMNDLIYNKTHISIKKWSRDRQQKYIENRKQQYLTAAHALLSIVNYCKTNNIPLIVENPKSWRIEKLLGKPTISHCRNKYGDYFIKPTNYYIYNVAFNENNLQEITNNEYLTVTKCKRGKDNINRSLMSDVYVNNFINCIER